MNKISCPLFKAFFASLILLVACTSAQADMSPSLENALSRMTSVTTDSVVSVLVFIDDEDVRSEVSHIAAIAPNSLKARHQAVIERLRTPNSSLDQIKGYISSIAPKQKIKSFWITPAISVDVPLSKVAEIENLPGVKSVIENAVLENVAPVESSPALAPSSVSSHLEALNIPALWDRGLTGNGRLVCNFDTGVEGDHPALASKWRGNHASSESSWFGPVAGTTTPIDNAGHGTHTMGVMVGSTAADSFGVAPSAEWISAAVVDQGLNFSATIADILSAFEWAVDPDGDPTTVDDMPDVILNSWGVPQSIYAPCDQTFAQAIDNVEAAGIIVIFSAGNEGPDPMSLRIPADNATTPVNTFSVGAINTSDLLVAEFSSRGPSACDQTSKKPEVVAPGVSIVSSYKDNSYRSMNGTSMAAPYIAGLAALLRQYNPDATVDEVKNAIIQSCTDLGPAGEDNDYGYGLPDAEKALQYMPEPPEPPVYIDTYIFGGDGIAIPGDTAELIIRLLEPTAQIENLEARLECSNPAIEITNDEAVFIFPGSITMSLNVEPFKLHIDDALVHGHSFEIDLILSLPFSPEYDTLHLNLTAGLAPEGSIVTHTTSQLEFSVSDFGQFGLGQNSSYNAGGQGFKFDQSNNLLYEAGIIIGRNELQLSSSVRNEAAQGYYTDFMPLEDLSTSYPDIDGGFRTQASYADSKSSIPIPIQIDQYVLTYDEIGGDDFIIMRFFLKNTSNEDLTGISFGYATDFDLGASGEAVDIFDGTNMVYSYGESCFIGILPVHQHSAVTVMENSDGKVGLTNQEKYALISGQGVSGDMNIYGDYMSCISYGPYRINAGDSVEIAMIMAAGKSLAELYGAASRGIEKYHGVTDVEEHLTNLPNEFLLHQNYPNPFNPTTTINFELTRATDVKLSVINVLGQEVTILHDGPASMGKNSVSWDGTNQNGVAVASGMYFYKIETDKGVQTRKMMLLK